MAADAASIDAAASPAMQRARIGCRLVIADSTR